MIIAIVNNIFKKNMKGVGFHTPSPDPSLPPFFFAAPAPSSLTLTPRNPNPVPARRARERGATTTATGADSRRSGGDVRTGVVAHGRNPSRTRATEREWR